MERNANSGEAGTPALEELIDVPIDSDILIEIINRKKLVSLSVIICLLLFFTKQLNFKSLLKEVIFK